MVFHTRSEIKYIFDENSDTEKWIIKTYRGGEVENATNLENSTFICEKSKTEITAIIILCLTKRFLLMYVHIKAEEWETCKNKK
jgi:hypothetical protein